MSGATSNPSTAPQDAKATQPPASKVAGAQLEEDDEFEDFPVEDWAKEEEVGSQAANTHLWEESWDDDDTSDEFSVQLKEELKKVEKKG
ncbi:26 proteasome complex subunit Sem1 like protein [Zymoseptoria brevis]|uniref:26S proteasome complex subunit SEM1 n=1 Tax=Zymoseptoria brevis TaxID=1047168 RepID=A0A0F4GH45_9PEZI|nr:26 proteasome complex subunit Sem1 like protein [Zymoseptoria brevis]